MKKKRCEYQYKKIWDKNIRWMFETSVNALEKPVSSTSNNGKKIKLRYQSIILRHRDLWISSPKGGRGLRGSDEKGRLIAQQMCELVEAAASAKVGTGLSSQTLLQHLYGKLDAFRVAWTKVSLSPQAYEIMEEKMELQEIKLLLLEQS